MKTQKYLLPLLILIGMGLSACAQKDSNFKDSLISIPNTTVVNPEQAAQAQAVAQGLGYKVQIYSIDRPYSSSDKLSVSTVMYINDKQYTITTDHSYYMGGLTQSNAQIALDQIANNSVQNAGVVLSVNAYCTGLDCSQYYILIDISKNGKEITQDGVMVDYKSGQNYALATAPGQFLSFKDFINAVQQGSLATQTVVPNNY